MAKQSSKASAVAIGFTGSSFQIQIGSTPRNSIVFCTCPPMWMGWIENQRTAGIASSVGQRFVTRLPSVLWLPLTLAAVFVLGRRVAIKTLTARRLTEEPHFRTRFLREARAISALSHPHIATIHDYGETDEGEPYIVMEFISGQSAKDLIEIVKSGKVKIPVNQRYALADAGKAHRDLESRATTGTTILLP